MNVSLEYQDIMALEDYWRKQANAYKACGLDQAMFKAIAKANKFETLASMIEEKSACSA